MEEVALQQGRYSEVVTAQEAASHERAKHAAAEAVAECVDLVSQSLSQPRLDQIVFAVKACHQPRCQSWLSSFKHKILM